MYKNMAERYGRTPSLDFDPSIVPEPALTSEKST